MTYHIHYDLIIAWAQSAQIQQRVPNTNVITWIDVQHPLWDPLSKYRVKPEPVIDVAYVAIDTGWNIGRAYDSVKYAKQSENLRKPIECVIKITRTDGVTTSVEIVKK